MAEQEYTPTEAEKFLIQTAGAHAAEWGYDETEAEEEARQKIEQIKAEVRAVERAKRPDREQIAKAVQQGITTWCDSELREPGVPGVTPEDAVTDAVLLSLALEPEAREVTDAEVEAAARGIHSLRETPLAWEQDDEPTREYDRKRARAALEAAREVSRG